MSTKKDSLISSYINTKEGREKLAASMASPLRGHFVVPGPVRLNIICPVYLDVVYDLQLHAVTIGDDEHKVLEIMDS